MAAYIYKIENLINHQCYIGQTRNINKRWTRHRTEPFNQNSEAYEYPLYRAIRKHGLENFSFEVLEECLVSELNDKEIQYIKQYDSYFHGYNQTFGGDTRAVVDKEKILGIILDLETTEMFQKDIAKKWDISEEMVQGINTGRYWHHDRVYPVRQIMKRHTRYHVQKYHGGVVKHRLHSHCIDCGMEIDKGSERCVQCSRIHSRKTTRPTKDELFQLLIEHHNFTYVANLFGVSDNAVKKWCKSYGIPHLTKDYMPQKETKEKQPFYPARPVAMIDLKTGKVIKIFPSKNQAEIELRGKATDAISHVLKGQRKSMYGYGWKYVDNI